VFREKCIEEDYEEQENNEEDEKFNKWCKPITNLFTNNG
jgi:hypothetical protein